jgi:phosphate acetyltransferase
VEEIHFVIEPMRGVSHPESRRVETDPVSAAMDMLSKGLAAACVSGSTTTAATTIRAALKIVGHSGSHVSGSFLLHTSNGQFILFADCAVIPEPTVEQLVAIARSSAATFERLVGMEARVAMLSFSTKGSGSGPSVERVREATALVRNVCPALQIDGEVQFDAAFEPHIYRTKTGSAESRAANVFVFPNLDAGNIAYKVASRLAKARAYGAILQGIRAPVIKLSRGTDQDDIIMSSLVAATLAHAAIESCVEETAAIPAAITES